MNSISNDSISNFLAGGSINIGNSKICVNLGNTIVSFAFFGIGPSLVAYSALKVLEEDEASKQVIPFSSPVTLPITAFIFNRILNMNALSFILAGGLYVCLSFIRGSSSPTQLSVMFKNLMNNVSQVFDRVVQKSRYSMQDFDSMVTYTVYLPDQVGQNDVKVCWTSTDNSQSLNSFCVYIPGPQNTFSKYMECSVPYNVNPNQVVVSYSQDDSGNTISIRIPKYQSVSVLLPVH